MAKRSMIIGAGLCVTLLFVTISLFAEEEEHGGVAMKEVSLEDSFRNLLEENKRLSSEKGLAEAELARLNSQASVFARRTRSLEERIKGLTAQTEEAEKAAEKDKETLRKEIAGLKDEMTRMGELLAAAEQKRDREKYFQLWKIAQKELSSTRAKIEQVSREKEKLETENGKAHYNLGTLLFKKGEYKQAAYEYEQAMKLLPNDPELYYNLAVIYDYYLDDPAKAATYYGYYMQKCSDPRKRLRIEERMAEKGLEVSMNEYGIDKH
jgi:tetratricopeptide (TPR) repeat protein